MNGFTDSCRISDPEFYGLNVRAANVKHAYPLCAWCTLSKEQGRLSEIGKVDIKIVLLCVSIIIPAMDTWGTAGKSSLTRLPTETCS